jgi:hypothetical protein
MHLQLAMGFGLAFNCPAELEASYAVPPNLFAFWHTVEPIMRAIIDHHPNRDPDSPEGLLWQFQRYLLVVPEVKNRRQRWQPSTAASASRRPIPNLALLAALRSGRAGPSALRDVVFAALLRVYHARWMALNKVVSSSWPETKLCPVPESCSGPPL